MAWPKGRPRPGAGRIKGSQNKLTRSIKEALLLAFNGMGGAAELERWGKKNQTEFYKICARLIPTEISGVDGAAIPVHITRTVDECDEGSVDAEDGKV